MNINFEINYKKICSTNARTILVTISLNTGQKMMMVATRKGSKTIREKTINRGEGAETKKTSSDTWVDPSRSGWPVAVGHSVMGSVGLEGQW